jgi:peroxiredoxin
MAIQAGDQAPSFKLLNSDLKHVSLEDYKGRKLVIQFFPMAFTPTCTKQLCAMRDTFGYYTGMNTAVIGISVDSPYTLARFKEEQSFPFPLLSDFNKETSRTYGAFYDQFIYNLKGVAKRASFVVDEEGIVTYAKVLENAGDLPDFDAIKQALEEESPL